MRRRWIASLALCLACGDIEPMDRPPPEPTGYDLTSPDMRPVGPKPEPIETAPLPTMQRRSGSSRMPEKRKLLQ